MKRIIILSILWLVLCMVQAKAERHLEDPNYTIYVSEMTTVQEGQFTLSVCMKNASPIGGYQFEMLLPAGFTIDHYTAKNGKEKASAYLSEERTDSDCHTFAATLQNTSYTKLKVLCYSPTADVFSGNDGEVATIVINVDPKIALGEYVITYSNVVLSYESSTYETEKVTSKIQVVDNRCDVNQDGVVNISDVTAVVDFIVKKQNRNSGNQ